MNNVAARNQQPAFTLLEVILALGILAAALAVVGEVTRLSYINAERAAMEGDAALIAESVMSQLVAGLIEPVDLPATEWVEVSAASQNEPIWTYSLTLLPTEIDGLLTATVEVRQITSSENDPIRVKLVRWVADPEQIGESE